MRPSPTQPNNKHITDMAKHTAIYLLLSLASGSVAIASIGRNNELDGTHHQHRQDASAASHLMCAFAGRGTGANFEIIMSHHRHGRGLNVALSSSRFSRWSGLAPRGHINQHHRPSDIVMRSSASTANIQDDANQSNPPFNTPSSQYPLVIIIGGSGFLGTQIRHQLQERDVHYISTSTPDTVVKNQGTNPGEEFVSLDLTSDNAEDEFYTLLLRSAGGDEGGKWKRISIISAMGTIGTKNDAQVNAALVRAISGAHRINSNESIDATVEKFVMIGNPKRVRKLARSVPFLKGYADGKEVGTHYHLQRMWSIDHWLNSSRFAFIHTIYRRLRQL